MEIFCDECGSQLRFGIKSRQPGVEPCRVCIGRALDSSLSSVLKWQEQGKPFTWTDANGREWRVELKPAFDKINPTADNIRGAIQQVKGRDRGLCEYDDAADTILVRLAEEWLAENG